jgi:hypothetical protein
MFRSSPVPSPSEHKNIVVFNIMSVECSLLSTNYSLYAFIIRSMFIFLISMFCFLFCVAFFYIVFPSLLVCKFTDYCHRTETQLQLINIIRLGSRLVRWSNSCTSQVTELKSSVSKIVSVSIIKDYAS